MGAFCFGFNRRKIRTSLLFLQDYKQQRMVKPLNKATTHGQTCHEGSLQALPSIKVKLKIQFLGAFQVFWQGKCKVDKSWSHHLDPGTSPIAHFSSEEKPSYRLILPSPGGERGDESSVQGDAVTLRYPVEPWAETPSGLHMISSALHHNETPPVPLQSHHQQHKAPDSSRICVLLWGPHLHPISTRARRSPSSDLVFKALLI